MSQVRYKTFGIVNREVITDPSLSKNAKVIYTLICCYCGNKSTCYPSNGTIADSLNIGVRTVIRGIKELKDAKIIERKGRFFKLI